MKCTLVRVDTGAPFVKDASLVTNNDGSVSFQLPAGGWAGQEPNQYGVRHDQAAGTGPAQSYQRATLSGNMVVFVTRPQDEPMMYAFGQGRAY
jgi:hypothetical protein